MLQDLYAGIIWGECMKKKALFRLIIIIISFLLLFVVGVFIAYLHSYSYYYYYLDTEPCAQWNTTWISEDGKIVINIHDHGKGGTVSFKQNGVVTNCYFESDRGYFADVYSLEALEQNRLGLYPEEHYERWAYKIVKEDTFTICVEQTTFLQIGNTITFYKIEKDKTDLLLKVKP